MLVCRQSRCSSPAECGQGQQAVFYSTAYTVCHTTHCKTEELRLCAGSPDAPVLLSAGKDSKQSSTAGALAAGLANDGDSSSQADMCATTGNQSSQYWQVDLGDVYQIVNVTVLNRYPVWLVIVHVSCMLLLTGR